MADEDFEEPVSLVQVTADEDSNAAAETLLALMPQLHEADRALRVAKALPHEEECTALDSMEVQVAAVLDAMTASGIVDVLPMVAALLEEGSNDFFCGTRGKAGMRVHMAARAALARASDDIWDAPVASVEEALTREMNTMHAQVSRSPARAIWPYACTSGFPRAMAMSMSCEGCSPSILGPLMSPGAIDKATRTRCRSRVRRGISSV
jgi:hypothetical protein